MRRALLVVVVVLGAVAVTASPASAPRPPSPVTPWIAHGLEAISSHRLNPPRAARALALVSRAMYQAAAARRTARGAAVAGAASTVLAYLFPDEAAGIRGRLAHSAAGARGSARARQRGFAVGRGIGEAIVERAQSDGSAVLWTGTAPVGRQFWVPTPPDFAYPPLEPLAGTWKTWNLKGSSQFRPGPPPAFGGARFRRELREVYAVSRSLTDEQRQVADYWADGAGTATPPGHWNAIAIDLVRGSRRSALATARLFAALNTAQADAFIACWDTKYTYWSLRPVSAVRQLIDASWTPYITTPPFPSYVSGHATTSGAASTVLGAFFPAKAKGLSAMAEEAALSRLYAGIHFRSDNEVGLELGRRVGRVAVEAYLRRAQPRAAGRRDVEQRRAPAATSIERGGGGRIRTSVG